MTQVYETIYLAPHLDDAVLSCGGQIYLQTQAGRKVLVLTVMAGDPPPAPVSSFARQLHDRWQIAGEVTQGRRREDAAACALLGADYLHWDIPDCIYRLDPQSGAGYYNGNEALFGSVHEKEAGLVHNLAGRLNGLPEHGRLVAPLAIGNHVDHQIVRRAVVSLPQARVAYYEDYPYAAVPGARERALGTDPTIWREELIPLNEAALQAKIAAIAAYTSQISTFFSSAQNLEEMIRNFAVDTGGERLWLRTRPG